MSGPEYCEPADLYRFAVPRGTFPNPGRLLAAVASGSEILTLDQHGFDDDQALLFRAEAGGSLPAPLVEGTTYYAIPLTDSTFQVASTIGGSAINLTTDGANIIVTAELPFASKIQIASAEVDEMTGHPTPLGEPYPQAVVTYTATRAAELMLIHTGQAPGVLAEQMKVEREKLARWRKGVAIRGAIQPPSANLALVGNAAASDPHGWTPEGGGLP
jgi:hypothetical protein